MLLSALLEDVDPICVTVPEDFEIASIDTNAHAVGPNSLFVVLPPSLALPHNDVTVALTRGAAAILSQVCVSKQARGQILVSSTPIALGRMLSTFHGRPSSKLKLLAITGTNGKTTVTWLVRHILRSIGIRCGIIGSLGAGINDELIPFNRTTPPPHILQPILAGMHAAGISHVCLEASSHGLALDLLAGTRILIGGMTNLTRDHLDFHGSFQAYAEAKALLFKEFVSLACFNVDDATAERFLHDFKGRSLSVSSAGKPANLVLTRIGPYPGGSQLRATYGSASERFTLPLLGAHNVANAAMAMGMSLLAGVELTDIIAALETAVAPPGRLSKISTRPTIFIDYAHIPLQFLIPAPVNHAKSAGA